MSVTKWNQREMVPIMGYLAWDIGYDYNQQSVENTNAISDIICFRFHLNTLSS